MVCGVLKYPCFNSNRKKQQTNNDEKETSSLVLIIKIYHEKYISWL